MDMESAKVTENSASEDRNPVREYAEGGPRKKLYPPKGSEKYGIKKSLEKMAVKYVAPKIEGPKRLHPCAPCNRESKHEEAINYCSECEEKLCSTCTTQHRKFQILQSHKVRPVQEAPNLEVANEDNIKTKLSETCTSHTGKIITLYCSRHDEVVCPACIATNHRECPEPQYIVKIATEMVKPDVLKSKQEELAAVKKDIVLVKFKRLGEKNRLIKERNAILASIDHTRAKILEALGKFEAEAKEKLERKFAKDMRIIKRDLQRCDIANSALDEAVKKIKSNDTSLLMIHIKRDAKRSLQEGKRVLQTVTEHLGRVDYKFTIDEGLEDWLNNWTSIGYFDYEETAFTGISVGCFDISQTSDPELKDYVFNSMTSLLNGTTVVCDWKNKRLKLLDRDYKILCHCETPGMPYNVCCINLTSVAVTIRDEKVVQFVRLTENQMQLERKFKTDEYCKGIAHKDKLLYITCGGEGEVQGQLRVYSMQGALVQTYKTDIHERPLFLQPKDVAINTDGTRFHVLDLKQGIVSFTKESRLISVFRDSELKAPLGMCIDGLGNVFVSDRDCNSVIQLNADGIKLGVVLKAADGVQQPVTICCQEGLESRLLVGMENSSKLLVFALQEKF